MARLIPELLSSLILVFVAVTYFFLVFQDSDSVKSWHKTFKKRIDFKGKTMMFHCVVQCAVKLCFCLQEVIYRKQAQIRIMLVILN